MQIFAERLKELRKAQNLTQTEAAIAIGITKIALNNYEQGLKKPKVSLIIKIARFYKVKIDYLLGLIDKPN